MNPLDKALVIFLWFVGVPLTLWLIYMIFFLAPISMYTQAECLRKGYPKYAVSIGLERYCMNLDGSVTVRVEKATNAK